MRIIFQNLQSGRHGPLTPYQRPLLLLLFLTLPLGVLVVVGSYVLTGEWFFDRFRYKKHTNPEVQFTTTETATSANDLLIAFNSGLRDLDEQARSVFGLEHEWHDPANEPAPKIINDFVHRSSDLDFLKKYNRVAIDRQTLESKLEELEGKVDESIKQLSMNSKADAVLQADRLVQKEISNTIGDLSVTKKRFDEVVSIYTKEK